MTEEFEDTKMGNQNPYIEEEQTTQWTKEKVQKDKQRSTKHTYKTKDWVTRTPLKPEMNSSAPEQCFICSVSSFNFICSVSSFNFIQLCTKLYCCKDVIESYYDYNLVS